MVLVKNIACVFLVFLHVAWLSSARSNPTGAKVDEISDTKASITISDTNGTGVKILAAVEVNSSKPSAKKVVRKSSKRSLGISLQSDGGFAAAFTADYHRPTHHPPKNNK